MHSLVIKHVILLLMKGKNVYRLFLVLVLSLFSFMAIEAQSPVRTTYIKGVVIDSLSREPLSYVAVFLKGSDKGLQTDENGRFEIQTKVNFINLQFSTLGYSSKEIFVNKGEANDIVVELVPTGVALKEVVVKPGKEHY